MSIEALYPIIKPSINIDFASTKSLDPRITFTRASTAVYYDGVTTAKAEENLLTDSDTQFINFIGVTKTVNATTSPSGSSNAYSITDDNNAGRHFLYLNTGTSVSVIVGQPYTLSIFAKASTATFVSLGMRASSGATGFAVVANLSTGTITTTNSTGTPTGTASSISNAGNGWYRISVTLNATESGIWLEFGLSNSATPTFFAGMPSYTGAGTLTAFGWGAQLEQRSSVTAYNATTTQPITNYVPVLRTALAGQPRFDHNPTTGESLGLFVEEQRTNLVTYSDDFSNAAWVVNGTPVITSNQVIAPDGTLTADTLAVSGSSNGFGVYRNVATSGTYASSLYFKLISGSFVLRIGLTGNYSEINCSTLAITNTGTGIGSVSAVGNNWYRFVSVGTVSVLSASQIYNIGTNTGTIAIWGAQLEAGAFPTSYIATVASQVTRSADTASLTGTNFSQWYNLGEGTIYVESRSMGSLEFAIICQISGNTDSNNYNYYYENSRLRNRTFTNGVLVSELNSEVIPISSFYRSTCAYKTDSFAAVFANTLYTDNSGSTPNLMAFYIGRQYWGGNILTGNIKKLAYYPFRLTNTQLQALTT